jgi:hypothetical protein
MRSDHLETNDAIDRTGAPAGEIAPGIELTAGGAAAVARPGLGRPAGAFWRTDTRALMGAIFMGLTFVLSQQVAHRIDGVLWPTLVIMGGISWATFTGLAVLLFRQPAALIMGGVQALIAVGTGLSPLAPFFIPANASGALVYSLVSARLSMERWSHHLIAQLATNLAGNLWVALGLYVILDLPVPVILVSSTITATAGTIGSSILTRRLHRSVVRSGLA